MARARQAADGGTTGDATARFLRELRQLRDYAGLEQAELAARAHYPHDYIRAAEVGPAPPDLPLLSAYVRGCGGTVEEWEDRWRSLTNTPALPLLATRSAGGSTAATAGARIGSVSPVTDVPDPATIVAALNRVAEKIAASTLPAPRPAQSTRPTITQSPVSSFAPDAQPSAAGPARRDTGTAPLAAKPALDTAAAQPAVRGGPFSTASRTTIAALIALAICLIVAVLAVFA